MHVTCIKIGRESTRTTIKAELVETKARTCRKIKMLHLLRKEKLKATIKVTTSGRIRISRISIRAQDRSTITAATLRTSSRMLNIHTIMASRPRGSKGAKRSVAHIRIWG